VRLLNEAMRRRNHEAWRALMPKKFLPMLQSMDTSELHNAQDEAQAIACLCVRFGKPEKNCRLVTGDRTLAERVAAQLRAWILRE